MVIPATRVQIFPCVTSGCPGEYLPTRNGMVCFCGSEMPCPSLEDLNTVYDGLELEAC